MAAAVAGVNIPTASARVVPKADARKTSSLLKSSYLNYPRKTSYRGGSTGHVRPVGSSPTPPGISEKLSESIKKAEEACGGEPESGECAAAWDDVEELSAAASHAREKLKDSDPLENYCKDNPETDECRTYDS